MLAVPDAGLSTGGAWVGAQASAVPMHALCSASPLAGGACGAAMAGLATLMAAQQGSAACLPALQVLAAYTYTPGRRSSVTAIKFMTVSLVWPDNQLY